MSKIVLTRKSEWMNRTKGYKVFIDGAEKGAIRNDTVQDFEVEAGSHSVQCKVNWMSSNTYAADVKPEGNTYIKVSSGMKYYWPLYVMLLVGIIMPYYFRLSKLPMPSWMTTVTLIFVTPPLLYFIYYFTFNRKNFLIVKEDETNPFK